VECDTTSKLHLIESVISVMLKCHDTSGIGFVPVAGVSWQDTIENDAHRGKRRQLFLVAGCKTKRSVQVNTATALTVALKALTGWGWVRVQHLTFRRPIPVVILNIRSHVYLVCI